jgi:uncharacterized protein (TIGR01777 family)
MSCIALSGSSGLIGSALKKQLIEQGHTLLPLWRSVQNTPGILWDIRNNYIETPALEGVDTVIHLAGHPITSRWNPQTKQEIESSRVLGTRLLVEGLRQMKQTPKTLICASAIGYYGDRGDEILTEQHLPGQHFLSKVSVAWEREALKAEAFGVRVVLLRFGIVLSLKGGALRQMVHFFQNGMAGSLGQGKQWMTWVSLQDTLRAILYLLEHEEQRGPFNIASPTAVTNLAFSQSLAQTLQLSSLRSISAFQLRLFLGAEMVQELLLSSTRCLPSALQKSGFVFKDTRVEQVLAREFQKKGAYSFES